MEQENISQESEKNQNNNTMTDMLENINQNENHDKNFATEEAKVIDIEMDTVEETMTEKQEETNEEVAKEKEAKEEAKEEDSIQNQKEQICYELKNDIAEFKKQNQNYWMLQQKNNEAMKKTLEECIDAINAKQRINLIKNIAKFCEELNKYSKTIHDKSIDLIKEEFQTFVDELTGIIEDEDIEVVEIQKGELFNSLTMKIVSAEDSEDELLKGTVKESLSKCYKLNDKTILQANVKVYKK